MPYKRKYTNRQPKLGDKVIATRNSTLYDGFRCNYEYSVVSLGNGYVVVKGDRANNPLVMPDEAYKIYEDIYYKEPKLKETRVKVYRFLGIPFIKRKTYIYE